MPNAPDAPMSADETMTELSQWISKALSKVEERLAKKKKKARGSDNTEEEFPPLVLRWSDPSGDEKDVHALDEEEMQGLGGSLAIAQKLYAIASRDASSLGDKQAYFVTIDGFPGRFPLVFDDGLGEGDDLDGEIPSGPGGEGDEDDEDDEDGGSSRGMMASRYGGGGRMVGGIPDFELVGWAKARHQHEQMLMKENRLLVQETLRAQRQVIAELSETVRNQDKTHVSLRVALEEMLDRKHARELEMRRLGFAEERKEKAIQMLEPFARSIAVKLMGPAAAAGENGQTLYGLLNAVFDSFTEEQLQGILSGGHVSLTPMQRQHLAELFVTMKNLEEQKRHANGFANAGNGAAANGVSGAAHAHADGGHTMHEERKGT